MTSPLNTALLKLPKRAETTGRGKLIQTFVDVGPLFTLLSSADHQVIFGRRGTGKTHALTYLADVREKAGDVVALLDLRSVGSSAGIYSDETVPLAERATRLLVDALVAIHEALLQFFVEHSESLNLSITGPALDAMAEAITQVRVVGSVETESKADSTAEHETGQGFRVALNLTSPELSLSREARKTEGSTLSSLVKRSGHERLYVNFGQTGAAMTSLAKALGSARLWVLIDEWSSVPLALQPYLADLFRRALFAVRGVTVKIGAIEQRSVFRLPKDAGDYVGIELGADASADINLDDFMVFDNDPDRAKAFFEDLVARHVAAVAEEAKLDVPINLRHIIRDAFTEKRAIEEFVRSCEGVPRDAINILALAAQRALDAPVAVQHVRVAALNWYQRDKEKSASANDKAQRLLHWIIDEVIGQRRARAFLIRSDADDSLIRALYDARVLHLLKRGVSTHDQPGIRYDVYKLDYGCYVDLMSTAKAPVGLLPGDGASFVEVPPDDYRSIRRAILDLAAFYSQEAGQQADAAGGPQAARG